MYRCFARAAWLLLATPICAFAFEAVDILTPADSGAYPAYPSDPLPPYNIWGQFGMMYDSNILRRSSGDNHELLTRIGIGGRWDQRIVGRQGLHAEGRVDSYVYNQFGEIDNIAYGGPPQGGHEGGNHPSRAVRGLRPEIEGQLFQDPRRPHHPNTQ